MLKNISIKKGSFLEKAPESGSIVNHLKPNILL